MERSVLVVDGEEVPVGEVQLKAVLWPYRFADMGTAWAPQYQWVVKALHGLGATIRRHKDFKCPGLEHLPFYNHKKDNPADICIYNHADASDLNGKVLSAKYNWFLKPTVPDEVHTTLDPLGYGPFSSITYVKPDFEAVGDAEVDAFFAGDVRRWVREKTLKFTGKYGYKDNGEAPGIKDYLLVLGQCAGDSVVTRHDFGSHTAKLEQVVRELVRVNDRPVVVKLHPYMDGKEAKDTKFSDAFRGKLTAISSQVHVFSGKSSVHNFLPGARCVLLANSGAGFEAMMHHKPIISWGCPEYRWVTYDLRLLAEMRRALQLDWFNPARQDRFLHWYMERYCFYDEASAVRRVKELLSCP